MSVNRRTVRTFNAQRSTFNAQNRCFEHHRAGGDGWTPRTPPRPSVAAHYRSRCRWPGPPYCIPRPSGALWNYPRANDYRSLPLGAFPGGAAFLESMGDRPSGKGPRRPTALAETRLPERSPRVATFDFVRNFAHIGRVPWGQNQRWHAPFERGRSWYPTARTVGDGAFLSFLKS